MKDVDPQVDVNPKWQTNSRSSSWEVEVYLSADQLQQWEVDWEVMTEKYRRVYTRGRMFLELWKSFAADMQFKTPFNSLQEVLRRCQTIEDLEAKWRGDADRSKVRSYMWSSGSMWTRMMDISHSIGVCRQVWVSQDIGSEITI